MTTQLVLGVQLPQSATLEAFVGETNAAVKAAAAAVADGRSERLFLHGPEATGKTHLLQGVCRAAGDAGARSVYVPLDQIGRDAEPLLAGLDDMECVCIDEVSAIASHRDAEIALLSLSEGLRQRGGRLLLADALPPADIGLALPDLSSRLGWGGVMAMAAPDDADKQAMLIHRAAQRGMELPTATARWLLRHGPRDVRSLMATLDTLDEASLAEQRRLTIPFVKRALAV